MKSECNNMHGERIKIVVLIYFSILEGIMFEYKVIQPTVATKLECTVNRIFS